MADGALNWMHQDDRGIDKAMAAGSARAKSGPWLDDSASTADFRGLLMLVCAAAALCGNTPPVLDNGTTEIKITKTTRTDDQDWQIAFGRTLGAFAAKNTKAIPAGTVVQVNTVNGDPGKVPNNVGFAYAWPVMFGVVGLAAIGATYLYFITSQENELASAKMMSDANQQLLATEVATAAEAITKHKAAEAASGTSIPYDDQEVALLTTLNAAIDKSTGWHAPPLKSIPNPSDITKPIGKAVDTVGSSLGLVPAAFALGILITVMR